MIPDAVLDLIDLFVVAIDGAEGGGWGRPWYGDTDFTYEIGSALKDVADDLLAQNIDVCAVLTSYDWSVA